MLWGAGRRHQHSCFPQIIVIIEGRLVPGTFFWRLCISPVPFANKIVVAASVPQVRWWGWCRGTGCRDPAPSSEGAAGLNPPARAAGGPAAPPSVPPPRGAPPSSPQRRRRHFVSPRPRAPPGAAAAPPRRQGAERGGPGRGSRESGPGSPLIRGAASPRERSAAAR